MSDFLPYQESLILHEELGFNEPCYAVYSEHDQTRVYDNDSIREGKIIPAILYQQAFRWFREKYGLRIRNYVFVNFSGGISEGFAIFKYSKDTIDKVEALTYEEAELACLKKLIEIVKNDK